jgi:hypothetical protein
VTSVAYSDQPQLPGWIDATLSLVVGWIVSGVAVLVLYSAASAVGAISQPYAWHVGALSDWPYAENGLWGLFANIAVILVALVLTTVATSWRLRQKHTPVSDWRLAVVLFFTGWLPVRTAGPVGGFVGFVLALVLVRHWVARHEDRLAPGTAAALVAVLGAVVVSYGLLHPLWTNGVFPTATGGKRHSALVDVRNVARVGVTVDHIQAPPGFNPARPARLRLAPGGHGLFALSIRGCAEGLFDVHARYHVLGLSLRETLPVRVRLGRGC